MTAKNPLDKLIAPTAPPDDTALPGTLQKTFWDVPRTEVHKLVLSAIVGAFFTACVSVLLWWVNSSSPHLIYTFTEFVPFQGDKSKFGIITMHVGNDGSKVAEDVKCRVQLKDLKVQEIYVEPGGVPYEGSHEGKTINLDIPDLNPMESVILTIKCDAPPIVLGDFVGAVTVRAKGVNGELVPFPYQSDSKRWWFGFWGFLGGVIAANVAQIVRGIRWTWNELRSLKKRSK
ncbi:MAG TPA: hypothetical protein VM165_17945 [Planctomycetaceae bacterium]|nr:hypothetical protein [Planctomycetaceae bacterium]